MRALLRRLPEAGDVTLIVSSHLLSEVEQIATHVGLLHRGRLLVEAPLGELLGGAGSVEIVTGDRDGAARSLSSAGFTVASSEESEMLFVGGGEQRNADPAEIAGLLVAEGHKLSHLALHRPSLERIYHRHVRLAA
jgi:ABC-2 type transport system ATP-binding protein